MQGEPQELKAAEELRQLDEGKRRVRQRLTCDPGYESRAECFCVRFSPDGQRLAASFSNGAIHVWEANTGRQEVVLNGQPAEGDPPEAPLRQPTTRLRWKPIGQAKGDPVLTSVDAEFDGKVQHWDVKGGACIGTLTEQSNHLFALDYSGDGSQFATAGQDRMVRVYDEATGKVTTTMPTDDLKEPIGHSNRVFSVKFSPLERTTVLSGGWDKTVRVWDTRTGKSEKCLWDCYICGDSLDIASDGQRVLAGSKRVDNPLQIWDLGTAKVLENVNWAQPASLLLSAQFSKDMDSRMILAGGSQENTARFFDCMEGQPAAAFAELASMSHAAYSVDFSPSSKAVAVGGADGKVRLLELL